MGIAPRVVILRIIQVRTDLAQVLEPAILRITQEHTVQEPVRAQATLHTIPERTGLVRALERAIPLTTQEPTVREPARAQAILLIIIGTINRFR